MPFVTVVQSPDSPLKYDPAQLESNCKEAWVAMADISNAGPFNASDVCGAISYNSNLGVNPSVTILQFYYTERPDRGLAFRDALFQELRVLLPQNIVVILFSAHYWFPNPEQSVQEPLLSGDF